MYRTATICRVLGVPPSGCYAWRRRAPCARWCADRTFSERIQAIHERSRGTMAWPRVHAEPAAEGVRVGRKRVARLMRGAELAGVSRCKGVRPSMGSVGDCYDNALCESFATLECELLARHRFRTQAEARMKVFEFMESWYNPHRRHSTLSNLSPIDYERRRQGSV